MCIIYVQRYVHISFIVVNGYWYVTVFCIPILVILSVCFMLARWSSAVNSPKLLSRTPDLSGCAFGPMYESEITHCYISFTFMRKISTVYSVFQDTQDILCYFLGGGRPTQPTLVHNRYTAPQATVSSSYLGTLCM